MMTTTRVPAATLRSAMDGGAAPGPQPTAPSAAPFSTHSPASNLTQALALAPTRYACCEQSVEAPPGFTAHRFDRPPPLGSVPHPQPLLARPHLRTSQSSDTGFEQRLAQSHRQRAEQVRKQHREAIEQRLGPEGEYRYASPPPSYRRRAGRGASPAEGSEWGSVFGTRSRVPSNESTLSSHSSASSFGGRPEPLDVDALLPLWDVPEAGHSPLGWPIAADPAPGAGRGRFDTTSAEGLESYYRPAAERPLAPAALPGYFDSLLWMPSQSAAGD